MNFQHPKLTIEQNEHLLKEFSHEIKFQRELIGYIKEYLDKDDYVNLELTKKYYEEYTLNLHYLYYRYIELNFGLKF